MRAKAIVLLSAILMLAVSCSKDKDSTDVSAHVIPVYAFMRDFNGMDSTQRTDSYRADSIEIQAFMRTVSEMPLSEELIEGWANSQAVAVFTPDVDSVFADTSFVSQAVGHVLSGARDKGIELPPLRYAAVVYGRPESMLFVDSVMLIAMNHYLGSDYPGYSHWPSYMRANKNPENLRADFAEAVLATTYPFRPDADGASLLQQMLYQGALLYSVGELCGSSAEALRYDDTTIEFLDSKEKDIWQSLISQRLLYDKSPATADRFLSPAPVVNIDGEAYPGRVGRYVGLRLVEAYMQSHPHTELSHLLSEDFYNSPGTLAEALAAM